MNAKTEPTQRDVKSPSTSAGAKKPWRKPRILSSETFTKAALACCGIYDGPAQISTEGSSGSNLPEC
jgi:hypothetical protein